MPIVSSKVDARVTFMKPAAFGDSAAPDPVSGPHQSLVTLFEHWAGEVQFWYGIADITCDERLLQEYIFKSILIDGEKHPYVCLAYLLLRIEINDGRTGIAMHRESLSESDTQSDQLSTAFVGITPLGAKSKVS